MPASASRRATSSSRPTTTCGSSRDWLDRAADGRSSGCDCDYVGGRVLPIWGAAPPAWLPNRGGKHWAVIALLDYGPQPIEFGARVPLGVNMAFRRERVRSRRPASIRTPDARPARCSARKCASGASARARPASAASTCPELVVQHIIPASRLNKAYFRRWFYWRGISRALLYERSGLDMEAPGADDARLPRPCRTSSACRAICIARRWQARGAPATRRCAATRSPRSITSCGSGSSPASSGSAGTDRRGLRGAALRCCVQPA